MLEWFVISSLTPEVNRNKDITVGHNKCGAYGWMPVCCETGYTATVGWDPVSGVGSPNIAALREYVLNLP